VTGTMIGSAVVTPEFVPSTCTVAPVGVLVIRSLASRGTSGTGGGLSGDVGLAPRPIATTTPMMTNARTAPTGSIHQRLFTAPLRGGGAAGAVAGALGRRGGCAGGRPAAAGCSRAGGGGGLFGSGARGGGGGSLTDAAGDGVGGGGGGGGGWSMVASRSTIVVGASISPVGRSDIVGLEVQPGTTVSSASSSAGSGSSDSTRTGRPCSTAATRSPTCDAARIAAPDPRPSASRQR